MISRKIPVIDAQAFEHLFKNHTLSSPLEDAIRVYLCPLLLLGNGREWGEKMWKDVKRCEKMWKDVKRCEKMWKDVKRCEKFNVLHHLHLSKHTCSIVSVLKRPASNKVQASHLPKAIHSEVLRLDWPPTFAIIWSCGWEKHIFICLC